MKPNCEQLESRDLASVSLAGGVLSVIGTNKADNLSVNRDGSNIVVYDNGVQHTFADTLVNKLVMKGLRGDDVLTNTVVGLQSKIESGDGHDNILDEGGNACIDLGRGDDVVHATTGTNSIQANHRDKHLLAVSLATQLNFSQPYDIRSQVVRFGQPALGIAWLDGDGVLQIRAEDGGSYTRVELKRHTIKVFYEGATVQEFVFDEKAVKAIAYVGGSGDDTFNNYSRNLAIAHGEAGEDFLYSSSKGPNILKGGADNDIVKARGRRADLAGDAGINTLDARSADHRPVIRAHPGDTVLVRAGAHPIYVL